MLGYASTGSLPGNRGGATRSTAVSRDECITLSNGRSLLVSDGGGGDGPVSVDGAGESGDLAGIPGGGVAAVDQADAGTDDGGAADARGGGRRAPTAGAAPVRTMAGAGGAGRDLPWDRGGAFTVGPCPTLDPTTHVFPGCPMPLASLPAGGGRSPVSPKPG